MTSISDESKHNSHLQSKNSLSKNKYILIITAIAYFLTGFSVSVISVALPSIAKEFAISAVEQNWVAIIFLMAIAIFSLPVGKISAKIGLKRIFYIGLILLIIGSLGASLSNSIMVLICFRALQGLSVAILNVSILAIVTEYLPHDDRGKGIGLITSISFLGIILANFLGGFLTHNFGWRSVFLFVIPFLIITLLITFFKVPEEWILIKDDKFDYISALMFGLGISFLIYGFTIMHTLNGIILIILSFVIAMFFIKRQLNLEFPLFPIKILKNKIFVFSSIAAFLCSFSTLVISYIVDYHLQYIDGIDPQITGLILMLSPIVMVISTFFSGWLSDKFNPQLIAIFGLLIAFIALINLFFLNFSTSLSVIILIIVLGGLGYGFFVSPNNKAVINSLPNKFNSLASATISTTRVVGESLSLGMLTLIFAIIMGSFEIIPKYFHLLIESSQIVSLLAAIGCLLGIFFSLIALNSNKL